MKCSFFKKYLSHIIYYTGCRDGKGIYGGWKVELSYGNVTGGFHIWPKELAEEAEAEAENQKERVNESVDLYEKVLTGIS